MLLRVERVDERCDCLAEGWNGPPDPGPQVRFAFAKASACWLSETMAQPGEGEGVEAGRVGRPEREVCTGHANGLVHAGCLVVLETVHHCDVGRGERREDHLRDVSQHYCAVNSAIVDDGRRHFLSGAAHW